MTEYVLVPLEPTREMAAAGEGWSGLPRQTWQDMIDAAPEYPNAIWAFRNNADDGWTLSLLEPEVCYEKTLIELP